MRCTFCGAFGKTTTRHDGWSLDGRLVWASTSDLPEGHTIRGDGTMTCPKAVDKRLINEAFAAVAAKREGKPKSFRRALR